jgi:hypothetical protein
MGQIYFLCSEVYVITYLFRGREHSRTLKCISLVNLCFDLLTLGVKCFLCKAGREVNGLVNDTVIHLGMKTLMCTVLSSTYTRKTASQTNIRLKL